MTGKVKHIRKPFVVLLLLTTAIISAMAQRGASIKASLDSVTLEMGRQTPLHLQIIVPQNQQGVLLAQPESTLIPEVEIIRMSDGDTTDIGNGLYEIKQDLIIQSFDSGEYVLPEIVYLIGNDSVKSNQVSLKVYPVDVSQMETINPDADIEKGDSRWWDFLPDFIIDYWEWILGVIVLICAGLYLYLTFRKKTFKLPFTQPAPQLSPYEVAIRDLSNLKQQNLCAGGQEKEYYTRLTDILRIYLQDRFGINAMEMTSSQITRALNENEATRLPNRLMRQILEIADFVKFAKVRPLPEDNVRSFNSALQFVEDTRPVPEPEESGKDGDQQANDSKSVKNSIKAK